MLLTADKIMATRNPYEIKRLSKQLPNSKEWQGKEKNIMKGLLKAKFSQSKFLMDLLIKSGDRQFHESTSDPIWGTGAELSSKALLNGDWSGKDLLGQLLEELRDELTGHAKQPTRTESADPATADDLDNITPMGEDKTEIERPGHEPTSHEDKQSQTVTTQGTPGRDKLPGSPVKQTSTQTPTRAPQTPQKSPVLPGSPGKPLSPTSTISLTGSPAATQAIIQDLTKKSKRSAPRLPANPIDSNRNPIQLRGNRVAKAPTATYKGKSLLSFKNFQDPVDLVSLLKYCVFYRTIFPILT